MRDEAIVELFFRRDERAIDETRSRYGPYCMKIASGLLGTAEDAEECVQDTLLAVWEAIPPARPGVLRVFLGRITRNLAISRYRRDRAAKRFAGMEAQLEELEECIPARDDVETELERRELGRAISEWLDKLPEGDRVLFVRRYWYAVSVESLARERGGRANTVAQRLRRLRLSLREFLKERGVTDEG